MKRKCISLWQPWATLLLSPYKRIETRTWRTHYRGRLLIHAAQRWTRAQRELCETEPFASCLLNAGHNGDTLPLGQIIGDALLYDCVPVAAVPWTELPGALAETERAFGDYRFGRWAWMTEDPQTLLCPRSYPGRMGLFDVEWPHEAEAACP